MIAEINQAHLERVVRSIFPQYAVKCNERKSAQIKSPFTGYFLELDVWIPDLNIAFEFQDPYHYTSTWSSQIPLAVVKQKDDAKLQLAQYLGETVILVPCWWDGFHDSLSDIINFHRPDLCVPPLSLSLSPFNVFPSSPSFPIPFQNLASLNPPHDMFRYGHVPDVGELMLASFPLSPLFVENISQNNTWWAGEKYDGVRVCWNSSRKYSRTGGEINLETNFENRFPDFFLDGELWLGRGNFPDTQRIIQSENNPLTPFLRLMGFDCPGIEYQKQPFEVRFENLLMNISYDNPCVNIAHRLRLTTAVAVKQMAADIVEGGGEGLVLRKPKSLYESGRSPHLMKLKAARGDREAVVVQVAPNSYLLKLPDETTFKVHAHNFKYNIKPKIGDIVTFSYDNYSQKSIPVKPTIYRIRTDLSWQDVVANFKNEMSSNALSLNDPSQKVTGFTAHPHGYWTSEKGKNMRNFFEKYALKQGLDPLSPDTWYNISRKDIESLPGARSILAHYRGKLIDTLISLFPEINLERGKFHILPNNYWRDINNRRKVFDKFAKSKGFDPLVPANWYSISKSNMLFMKSAKSMFRYVKTPITHTLIPLYPEVEFVESNFVTLPNEYWEDEGNRRRFFKNFAKVTNLTMNEQWYDVDKSQILNFRGGSSVLEFYGGSLVKALISLFPALDSRKFDSVPKNHWQVAHNRKQWFISFAKEHNFDPNIPENWYSISKDEILSVKGGRSVLSFHRGNLHEALSYLFPEINFEELNFISQPANYWNSDEYKKAFFIKFATDNLFDPKIPENWYNITNETFASRVGSSKIIIGPQKNFIRSLIQSFPELSFDTRKFLSPDNRRNFFETIAASNGVNPIIPDSWYELPVSKILSTKGANSVLSYHRGSVVEALTYLFNELDWDHDKFSAELK